MGETERILEALAAASDDGLVVVDAAGCVRRWSSGATRLLGFTAQEMSGRPLVALLTTATRPRLDAALRAAAASTRESVKVTANAADGWRVDLTVQLAGLRDADGQPDGAALVLRDVGVQARTEAALDSQERLRALLDSTVDAIIVIDAAGRIETFNLAAQRLFGYTEAETIGQKVNMLMPSPYHEEHDGYMSRYLREGAARVIGIGREVTARRKDGTTFPVHLAVGEMSLRGQRKFTGILHDLSARAALEAQVREQAALVRLGEMAAVIAHEVKNPLAGIRGAIQVIGTRLPAGSPEAGITGEIVSRIDALNALIKDLLLFARPPRPNPTPVDVVPLVVTTAELLATDPAMSRARVTVEGQSPPVAADPGLLKIVFLNLLMNAAQAMKGSGAVSVSVQVQQGRCVVDVLDEGPGIPPDVREKIFTPFFTTKARGTGLGLPTARRLIEAHSGKISIECPPGGGTRVRVELPIHQ